MKGVGTCIKKSREKGINWGRWEENDENVKEQVGGERKSENK